MRFSSCRGGIARRVFANLRHPNLKLCDPALPDRLRSEHERQSSLNPRPFHALAQEAGNDASLRDHLVSIDRYRQAVG